MLALENTQDLKLRNYWMGEEKSRRQLLPDMGQLKLGKASRIPSDYRMFITGFWRG